MAKDFYASGRRSVPIYQTLCPLAFGRYHLKEGRGFLPTRGYPPRIFDEIVSSIIAVNIIAALTGSSLTSLQILFDTFLDRIRISELPAENIHRIIAIASGGLDSMPYATGVVVANDLAHTEQSKTYKHIFITCALIPLLALVLTVAISYLL